MNHAGATLSTPALTRADQAELLEYLSEDAVRFRVAPLAPGELGEPVTAIAIVALSMVSITGMCAWLAAKGRGISMTLKASAPGVSGEITVTVTEQSHPAAVRADFERQGVRVPEK
jgi:hypothetical protein